MSCTNTTTSNNTLELANITLLTTLTSMSTTTTFSIEPVISTKQHSIKESACIATPKKRPPTLYIFHSRDFQLKCHKEYSSPFTQSQTILTTARTTHHRLHHHCYKLLPSVTSPPTSPQPTTTHSISTTGKHLPSEKNTTPTSTITITPTTTTTTPPTRIPALMNINTYLPPRFQISSPHTSSIAIPLSPSIPPTPIFPPTLQELQQSGLWGGVPTTPTPTERSHHHLAILKCHQHY